MLLADAVVTNRQRTLHGAAGVCRAHVDVSDGVLGAMCHVHRQLQVVPVRLKVPDALRTQTVVTHGQHHQHTL